jgi:hypothetical protein
VIVSLPCPASLDFSNELRQQACNCRAFQGRL